MQAKWPKCEDKMCHPQHTGAADPGMWPHHDIVWAYDQLSTSCGHDSPNSGTRPWHGYGIGNIGAADPGMCPQRDIVWGYPHPEGIAALLVAHSPLVWAWDWPPECLGLSEAIGTDCGGPGVVMHTTSITVCKPSGPGVRIRCATHNTQVQWTQAWVHTMTLRGHRVLAWKWNRMVRPTS